MAWKRGTQNNQAGEIRKGHIREFLLPSSRELSVTCTLKIIDTSTILKTNFHDATEHDQCHSVQTNLAFINFDHMAGDILAHIKPNNNQYLYLHAHEHPICVLTCAHDSNVTPGCIALSEIHRANSKVCIGEQQEWSVYQGEVFAFDARDVSIGDTQVRAGGDVPHLQTLVLDIRSHITPTSTSATSSSSSLAGKGKNVASTPTINAKILRPQLCRFLMWNIISAQETYLFHVPSHDENIFGIVLTVAELRSIVPCKVDDTDGVADGVTEKSTDNDDDDEDETFDSANDYRGLVTHDTVLFLRIDPNFAHLMTLIDNPPVPPPTVQRNIVHILTSDNECFPVKRKLLRPCLALTSVVQAGRGIYSVATINVRTAAEVSLESDQQDSIPGNSKSPLKVDVDACTFDRVLLYLEHEARGDTFRFDPLIVTELREAAIKLKIRGLLDSCDKVLGSFEERVWKVPIRLTDVLARNKAGEPAVIGGKRGDTLLLMAGMVLDITRWLDEHPGGSTIIPQQALNVDSTVFFEIYHASKQSFLYLKEFYIGELAEEDRPLVAFPSGQERAQPSHAFMEELKRVTPWRLKSTDFKGFIHKSF